MRHQIYRVTSYFEKEEYERSRAESYIPDFLFVVTLKRDSVDISHRFLRVKNLNGNNGGNCHINIFPVFHFDTSRNRLDFYQIQMTLSLLKNYQT